MKGIKVPIRGVPTNKDLFDNAPDTVEEALRHWLANHVSVLKQIGAPSFADGPSKLEWAARNLRYDPEVLGALKKEFGIEC